MIAAACFVGTQAVLEGVCTCELAAKHECVFDSLTRALALTPSPWSS